MIKYPIDVFDWILFQNIQQQPMNKKLYQNQKKQVVMLQKLTTKTTHVDANDRVYNFIAVDVKVSMNCNCC